MQPRLVLLALIATFLPPAGAESLTSTQPSLTLAGARQLVASAEAEAQRLNAPGGCFAVVDAGGHVVALERLDRTFTASAEVSIGKARTAAEFGKPTKVFEDIVNNGRTTMVALDRFTPLQGGAPVIIDGSVVGAIGVSGAASAQQDDAIAQAAVAAFMSRQGTHASR